MSYLRILGWAKSIIPALTLFFALAVLVANPAAAQSISGTVFEDINYGGGAGRNRATALAAGGTGRSGARVNLHDGAGNYLTQVTTSAAGLFTFSGLAPGTYTVLVENGSVTSGRTGYTAAMRAVLTFRTDGTSGTPLAVTSEVGGTDPTKIDSPATNQNLSAAYSSTTAPQNLTRVTLGASNISGVDFGFNFATVVNLNDSGRGSLRMVTDNLRGLTGALSVTDVTGRVFTSNITIFMIPDGSSRPGLNPAFDLFTASGCGRKVASILIASPLTISNQRLDAQTHPAFDAATGLPLIELTGNGTGSVGVSAAGTAGVSGFIINRFPSHGIQTAGTAVRLEGSWVGLDCTGNAAAANGGDGIFFVAGSSHVVGMRTAFAARYRMVVSGNAGNGVRTSLNLTVQGSYIGTNAAGTMAVPNRGDGINFTNSNLNLPGSAGGGAWPNVISGNAGWGVRIGSVHGLFASIDGNVIGRSADRSAAVPNGAGGILIGTTFDFGTSTCYAVSGSTIASNNGPGIRIDGGTAAQKACVKISNNSIYGNAGLGIDLAPGGLTGVTPNDGVLGGAGTPNLLMDFPVFSVANLTGNTLNVTGYVGNGLIAPEPNPTVEVYKADALGQGKTYLGAFVASGGSGTFNGQAIDVTGKGVVAGDTIVGIARFMNSASVAGYSGYVGSTSEFSAAPVPVASGTVAPGAFNAFETSTAAGALSGVLKTKVAGQAFAFDVVALNAVASSVLTTFNNTAKIELVDGSGGTACAARVALQTVAASYTFTTGAVADNGRHTFSGVVEANAWPDALVRITSPAGSPTVTSCSIDHFAIRPASLAVVVSDATASTAGTARALTNTATVGGVVHRAGRPFTITATAYNGAGTPAITGNYAGAPDTLTLTALTPATCATCALTLGSFSGAAGSVASNTASYNEAGTFTLQLADTAFAAIDSADSSTAERYIVSSAVNVGRFVPDAFVLSAASLTNRIGAACSPASSFTYLGETLRGTFTLSAINAAGATTVNYAGSLAQLDPGNAANWQLKGIAGATELAPGMRLILGTASGAWSAGVAAGVMLDFTTTRLASPEAPLAASFGIAPVDADGVALQSYTLDTDSPANGNDRGMIGNSELRFGRLRLSNAFGSEKSSLAMPVQAQYWSGLSWVLNSADSCTSLPASAFFLASGAPAGVNASAVSLAGGVGTLTLSKPTPTATGSVDVAANLGASGSDQSCLTTHGGTAANLPWLRAQNGSCAASFDRDPSARATFGIYPAETRKTIHVRERF